MKKLFSSLAFACLVSFAVTGCRTSYRDGGADGLYRPVTHNTNDYYTEYDISQERLHGEGTAATVLWVFQISDGKYCLMDSDPNVTLLGSILQFFSPTQVAVGNAKKTALFNVLSEKDADQLLGAVYEYTVTNYIFYTKVECKVKGFPATVKGVKFPDKKPIILNKWQKVEYISPHDCPYDFSQGNASQAKSLADSQNYLTSPLLQSVLGPLFPTGR